MHLFNWCARAAFYRALLSVQGIGGESTNGQPVFAKVSLEVSTNPSSTSRKFPAEPESLDLKTIVLTGILV